MKKLQVLTLLFSFFILTSLTTKAQQWFVYDGDVFSVMLTCNSDNSRVLEVAFSYPGDKDWTKFSITDYTDLENAEGKGFLYTVKDGEGQEYTIDYVRNNDNIVVTNTKDSGQWTLPRRKN